MGYKQSVTDCTAVLPAENFPEALRRLRGQGRGRSDYPSDRYAVDGSTRAAALQEAFAEAGWEGTVGPDGAFHLSYYTNEVLNDVDAIAISELGDLFAPDGIIGWLGEDGELWGWRVNHCGRAVVEVNGHTVYDTLDPTDDPAPRSASHDVWGAAEVLMRCAYAVDEACDVLTSYANGTAEGHEVSDLLEVLFDARRELLVGARPELRAEWEVHEATVRRLASDPGADEEHRELVRDRRESVYQTICREAMTAATGELSASTTIVERTPIDPFAGEFVDAVLAVAQLNAAEPHVREAVAHSAIAFLERQPVPWRDSTSDSNEWPSESLYEHARRFVADFSRQEYAARDTERERAATAHDVVVDDILGARALAPEL